MKMEDGMEWNGFGVVSVLGVRVCVVVCSGGVQWWSVVVVVCVVVGG